MAQVVITAAAVNARAVNAAAVSAWLRATYNPNVVMRNAVIGGNRVSVLSLSEGMIDVLLSFSDTCR